MIFKIYLYLGFIIGVLIKNSDQGLKTANCELGVVNGKIQLRCDCADGETPYGWVCRPQDTSCPNGYFDIFENKCKCIRYKDKTDSNSECENLCGEECNNGICLGSGQCACKEGYSMSLMKKCEPFCKNGCEHGVCIAPELCRCNEGYATNGIGYPCQPICEYDCENSYCLSPNWCSCYEGYSRVGPNECQADDPDY